MRLGGIETSKKAAFYITRGHSAPGMPTNFPESSHEMIHDMIVSKFENVALMFLVVV